MLQHTTRRVNRRTFIAQSSAAFAAASILPSGFALAANERPNIAAVGVGGKGWSDITETSKNGAANVIAFCDVETGAGRKKKESGYGAAAEKWPNARRYTDWREMFDKEGKQLNGVTISTPDHMHAPVTMTAMQMGLAVYTQKPLTRTIHEARQLTLAARKTKVVTQMGNQGHSGLGYRRFVQLVQDGAIGKIKEAHTWSNRPTWPQGIDRPEGSGSPPASFSWDLWLGVAPERPFVAGAYHTFNWRGWYDFGAGALGDMGCHIIDPVVWGLELGAPSLVWYEGPTPKPETFPKSETIHYEFPGTKYTAGDKVRMTWYDGGLLPDAALAPLPAGAKMPSNGILIIGEKGVILNEHGGGPQLLPKEKFADYKLPELESRDHYLQWTNAIRGEGKTTSHFDYAGPLTETVLLGTIASRFPNQQLTWDSSNLRFTNNSQANNFVRQPYRKGWEVAGL